VTFLATRGSVTVRVRPSRVAFTVRTHPGDNPVEMWNESGYGRGTSSALSSRIPNRRRHLDSSSTIAMQQRTHADLHKLRFSPTSTGPTKNDE